MNYFHKKKLKEFYDISVGYLKLRKAYLPFISKHAESFNISLKSLAIGFDGLSISL